MNNRFSLWLFERRTTLLAVVVLVAFLCSPVAALASNNDLPWNTALERLVNAFSGRTALLVSMIGIFFAGGMLIFGGDLGNFGKMVMSFDLDYDVGVNYLTGCILAVEDNDLPPSVWCVFNREDGNVHVIYVITFRSLSS